MIEDLITIFKKWEAAYLKYFVSFSQYQPLVWRKIHHTVGAKQKQKMFKTVILWLYIVKLHTKKDYTLHNYIKRVIFQTCLGQGFDVALDKIYSWLLVAKLFHMMVHIGPGQLELEFKKEKKKRYLSEFISITQ